MKKEGVKLTPKKKLPSKSPESAFLSELHATKPEFYPSDPSQNYDYLTVFKDACLSSCWQKSIFKKEIR